jgi:hypothetical protein
LLLRTYYATLHQLALDPNNFLAITQRKHEGNTYASFGVVHERKETTRDELLGIRS